MIVRNDSCFYFDKDMGHSCSCPFLSFMHRRQEKEEQIMTNTQHYFGEQTQEFVQGQAVSVWQSPKFIESRNKACELIDSGKYGLTDGDFWILKNKTKNGKIGYTGLIVSHTGCLKINEVLRQTNNAYNPSCISEVKVSQYTGGIYMTYCDDEVFEIAEATKETVKNAYPLAILLKRLIDRVILKKAKIAFDGLFSEEESDNYRFEEGRDYTVDAETGEVSMMTGAKEPSYNMSKKPVKAPLKMPIMQTNNSKSVQSKGENASEQVKVPILQNESISLEEALDYKTSSTNPKFKGIQFSDVLAHPDHQEAMKWLTIVASRSKATEKAAATTVLNAIKNGELAWISETNEDLPF